MAGHQPPAHSLTGTVLTMPVLPTTPAVRNATSKASHCVGKRIQNGIDPRRRAVTSCTKAAHAVQNEEQSVEQTRCGSNSLPIHSRWQCPPTPLLLVGSVSSLKLHGPVPNKRVLANPFSTAAPGDAIDDPIISIQQLEADTDAALQGGECNLLGLLDCWTHRHEIQRTGLKQSEWSDPGSQRLRRVVQCAERVDALVRSYHDGTLNTTMRSTQEDELEPYRVSMRVWSLTPAYYSGDRAAAVLELWGDKYGGDMTKQPTIEAFDVVLKAYALSSGVHANEGDFEEEGSSIEYPDDKAVSTLRLLNNLGDMYLAPTVTTVSYVIQALRRASRTPRGYNDGQNEKRTRTAITLLREIEGAAANLFHDISSDLDDDAKLRQQRYVQALCDALTMSVTSLPLNEAIEKSQFFLDEIDRCAFQNSELIPSLASVENKRDLETSQTIYLLRNMIRYTLDVYRNRATYDENEAEYSRNSANHILPIARAGIDVIDQAKRWAGVLLPWNYVTFEKICSLAADPSVIHDPSVGVDRDIVHIILAAEEMLSEANVDLPFESFRQLMHSWANLSGHVASVVGHDGNATSPAERVTKMMTHRRDLNSMCHPEEMVDLTGDYNCTLQAWSKARAGKLGAVRGLELFDEMKSDTINATPNEVTYGLILKCLRYSNSPSMAMKAESIIAEMHERYENEEEGSVRPNARHYGAAIAAIAKSGHKDAAKSSKALLKRILKSYHESKDANLLPNHFMFCEVINAIGRDRGDNLNKALKIQNLLRNLVDLYEETGHEDLMPNEVVFTTAISAIASTRDDDNAVSIMEAIVDEMRSFSIRPNGRLMTTMIHCYGNFHQPETAESVLREMEAIYASSGNEQFRPSNRSYNAAILAWAKVGNAARCRALLGEMLETFANGNDAIKPNSKTFVSVINSLWKSGVPNAPEEAIEILQLMEDESAKGDKDLAPTTAAYTAVINAIARSDLSDKAVRAKKILDRARRHVKLDASILTGVLNACGYTKASIYDRQSALAIAQEVEAELHDNVSLQWDSIAFNTLLQVYGYLVTDQTERDRLSSGLFKQCCQKGMVSKPLLGTLRRFSPSVYHSIGDESLFTKDGGHIKFGKLPLEWTRNAPRRFGRSKK